VSALTLSGIKSAINRSQKATQNAAGYSANGSGRTIQLQPMQYIEVKTDFVQPQNAWIDLANIAWKRFSCVAEVTYFNGSGVTLELCSSWEADPAAAKVVSTIGGAAAAETRIPPDIMATDPNVGRYLFWRLKASSATSVKACALLDLVFFN
jgi:hypothetical protein